MFAPIYAVVGKFVCDLFNIAVVVLYSPVGFLFYLLRPASAHSGAAPMTTSSQELDSAKGPGYLGNNSTAVKQPLKRAQSSKHKGTSANTINQRIPWNELHGLVWSGLLRELHEVGLIG